MLFSACVSLRAGVRLTLPSPGNTPRAPLLWLLLPFMAGIVAASCLPCPSGALPWLAGAALGLTLAALVLTSRTKLGWAVTLPPAVALGGFVYLPLDIRQNLATGAPR